MRFTYTYRSSDGQRHTAEIEAENRDAAFAKLRRELGVKPIKVTLAGGAEDESRRDGGSQHNAATEGPRPHATAWRAAILVVVGFAVVGGAWWWLGGRGAPPKTVGDWGAHRNSNAGGEVEIPGRYAAATYPAFTNLIARSKELESRLRSRTASLNLDLLHNYALIRRLSDLSELYEEIDKGRQVVNDARAEARDIFGGIYELFPPECVNERIDAEKLYDGLMTSVDAVEQRLDDEEEALVLLDDNRDKWDVQAGRLVFTDTRLEREFKFYNRPTEASSVRWRKDFGHGGIETAPVAVPNSGISK